MLIIAETTGTKPFVNIKHQYLYELHQTSSLVAVTWPTRR